MVPSVLLSVLQLASEPTHSPPPVICVFDSGTVVPMPTLPSIINPPVGAAVVSYEAPNVPPPDTLNFDPGAVSPMPTLPVDEINIVEVACAIPASLPTKKLPLVRFIPAGRSPVALVRVSADGVPSAGVTRVGDVLRTTSPVPVHVKRLEVAMLAASPVAPVMLPKTELAETCARFANGRSPVMASVSE